MLTAHSNKWGRRVTPTGSIDDIIRGMKKQDPPNIRDAQPEDVRKEAERRIASLESEIAIEEKQVIQKKKHLRFWRGLLGGISNAD